MDDLLSCKRVAITLRMLLSGMSSYSAPAIGVIGVVVFGAVGAEAKKMKHQP